MADHFGKKELPRVRAGGHMPPRFTKTEREVVTAAKRLKPGWTTIISNEAIAAAGLHRTTLFSMRTLVTRFNKIVAPKLPGGARIKAVEGRNGPGIEVSRPAASDKPTKARGR